MFTVVKVQHMKIYLRILSVLYFVGGVLHLFDLFGLRLKLEELSLVWKIWIIYLMIFDIAAAIGLWQLKKWGTGLFLIVAVSQLVAYIGFADHFGKQYFLIVFHLVTLIIYGYLHSSRLLHADDGKHSVFKKKY